MVLTENGKTKALQFNIETMAINKPELWDKKWRMILFDIPKGKDKEREAFRAMLKRLGFMQYQKSAFILPYECKNEVEYVSEFFRLRPFVRLVEIHWLDDELAFKEKFGLV